MAHTDVATYLVSGVDPKNATCVVFCQRTGEYENLDSISTEPKTNANLVVSF